MFISSWKPCQSLCGFKNFVKAKLLCNAFNTLKAKHELTMQSLVQIESTKELNNTTIIVIKLLLHQA
jgi:hypothetical protein